MISIVLGTFNRLNKLINFIDSVNICFSKLNFEPEIIVIDGGSTDGTINYLKQFNTVKIVNEGALHGVTRAYNKGFRIASRKYLTWGADDFVYEPDAFKIMFDRLNKEDDNVLLSFSIDVGDGKGFINYAPNTPIGIANKKLFEKVDFFSEDFITYASDNDFSNKIIMSGGKVLPEFDAKIIHKIDIGDYLHKENLHENKCSKRYASLYQSGIDGCHNVYQDIWVNAANASQLYEKIIYARNNIGWVNFYTDNLFEMDCLFNSMNVKLGLKNKKYNKVI